MADWTPVGAPVPVTPDWKPTGSPQAIPFTPEERYERLVGRLPKVAQYAVPGTIGEAGFALGALPAAAAAVGLAPETAGASLIPLIGAIAGGSLEDPKHPFSGASYEMLKGLLTQLGGKIGTKGIELGTRWLDKPGILERTAQRIGQAVPSLFYKYPFDTPQTATELREQLGGGVATDAVGKRLGNFRNALTQTFGDYHAGEAPRLLPASPGQPYRYTAAVPPSGRAFRIFDLDADGKVTTRLVSIGEAIDHNRELFAASRTMSGAQKGSASAPKLLELAHLNRQSLTGQLNQIRPGLGDQYNGFMGDYAMAKRLEKVFAGSERTTTIGGNQVGVVDQPKLLKKADAEEARLQQIRTGAGKTLHQAVSPTGAAATIEEPLGARAHGGLESGLRAILHLPKPYLPETRALLPWQARILSDPRMAPMLGALGLTGSEDILGTKGQQ